MTPKIWTPRQSQQDMLDFCASRPKRALWAKMGAGKTAVALTWLAECAFDRFTMDRALVVAPRLVARDTWPQEVPKWAQTARLGPVRVLTPQDFGFKAEIDVLDGRKGLMLGDKKAARARILGYTELVHTVSWDQFYWLSVVLGPKWPYTHLVMDESDFVANASSHRSRAARWVVQRTQTADLLQLAGTPATATDYEDVWAQLVLLDGGAALEAPTLTAFRDRWCEPDKRSRDRIFSYRVRASQLDELRRRCATLAMSVQVDFEVPVFVNDILVPLPESARAMYDDLEDELFHRISPDAVVLADHAATLTTKLLQVSQGAVYDEARVVHQVHDAKLDRLAELLESTKDNVLLAYPFKPDWARIKARFKFARHINDPGALEQFKAGKVKLLCLHPASGAHGIDGLQLVSSTVVWFGVPYSLRFYQQFNARLARPGQQGTVVVHRLIGQDTLEEGVVRVVLDEKASTQEGLLEAVRWRGQARGN